MKTAITFAAFIVLFVGSTIYDATGDSKCRVEYSRSFDGLWLVKEKVCYGRLMGLQNSHKELGRKALFDQF